MSRAIDKASVKAGGINASRRAELAPSRRQLLKQAGGLAAVSGAVLLGGAAGGGMLGLSRAFAADGDTLEKIKREKYARVASYQQPPHGWFDLADGKEKGIDFEILQYVMDKIGVEQIDYVVADWTALIPGLQASRWDLMSVGMGITKPRLEQILYSEPMYQYGEAMIVPKGNPKNIKGASDWNGKSIGGILGSVDDQVVGAVKGAKYVPYQKYADMYLDIKHGRIDAGLADETEAAWDFQVQPQPDLEIVHEWTGKTVYLIGMGFRKSDTTLLNEVNSWISKMKADGSLLAILKKYGLTEANMAPCATWSTFNETGAAQC
jgi:polar amino acid transport system substrate-binding protein